MDLAKNNNLYHVDLRAFLEVLLHLDTPTIIYNIDQLKSIITKLKSIIDKHNYFILNFAIKSCYNQHVLNFLSSQDIGCDVASRRELDLAKKSNFKYITSTAPCYSLEDMQYLKNNNVIIDINSIYQLIQYGENFPFTDVGLRLKINPTFMLKNQEESRFGIKLNDKNLMNIIDKYRLNIVSLHVHNENVTQEQFIDKLKFLFDMLQTFSNVKVINLGGGLLEIFSNPTILDETLNKARKLLLKYKNINKDLKIIMEPGSAIMQFCGYLLTTVVNSGTKKGKYADTYVEVDSSAWSLSPWGRHESINLNNFSTNNIKTDVEIYGNTCYEFDMFSSASENKPLVHRIAPIQVGDKLLFSSFGAYTATNQRDFNLQKHVKEKVYINNTIIV